MSDAIPTDSGPAAAHPTSAALLAGIVRGARLTGLPIDDMLAELPVSLATIESSRAFVDWDQVCAFFEQLEHLTGGTRGLYELGLALPERTVIDSRIGALLRIAVTPKQLYKLMANWYGPANMPAATTELRFDGDGRIHLTTAIDPRCRDCPQLFHLSEGALSALPSFVGLGHAAVESSISERRAAFAISPPPAAGVASRFKGLVGVLRSAQPTIDELAEQQELLRKSHQALEVSESRFRRLAENTRDMLTEWDPDGRCVYVSPNVKKMLGWSPEYFREHAWDIIHPDDFEVARNQFQHRFEMGGSGQVTFRLRRASGVYRWIESSSNAATTETGEHRLVTVSRDFTERHDLEIQVHQSQKIEALGRLAGGVAHDFNNLLTIIGGASEALLETVPAEGEQHEDVQMILEAVDRAAALTRQLLTFGRRQSYDRRPLDLGSVAREMEPMLSRLLRENVELAIDIDEDLSMVLADAGQAEQVIVNLTVNAIDAMTEGGTVRIVVRNQERVEGRRYVVASRDPAKPHVELSVEDTGVGIDPETVTRIFDPFFTTKETGRGTGLGLATVHGVVEQLGGGLSIETALGEGTRVSLLLPAYQKRDEVPPLRPAQAAMAGNETILLVDDEPAGRGLIRRQLAALGYEVLAAGSAEEAIAAFSKAETIDLLLTDLAMPGRDGLSLARELRAARPDLKILFISGYAQASIGSPLIDPDKNLLGKPFRAEVLGQKVREILEDGP